MIEPITAEQIERAYTAALPAMAVTASTRSQRIIVECAIENGVSVADLKSTKRTRDVAWPRQDCFLRLREHTNLSLTQIGRMFSRDHTTVLYGIRRATARRAEA